MHWLNGRTVRAKDSHTNLITYAVHLHVDQQMMHFGQLKVSQSKKKKKKPIGKLADCLSNASGSSNALLE